ncbi:hypothetical protein H5154_05400 [Pseudoalteromonas sp. SR44-5]|uniref:Lysozyme inhibitor LprI N-terminal domain-containing protein n=1 Tax=Pseudoalteromonas rhizosphaerae TaxID=2518973 RepID=A0ABW8L0G6_9GAMM|nr:MULTISPECIES: hypothetical protein [unclassified Pseudoalteromonas]MBB1332029.1 hypothetical protein [Pseudoalteromonas sp. SR41-6]MBB1340745.1 hypothetical protein [Pseudoalteromonas sp. SR45-6]MBB1365825.1 hypothetical protein [Pseudoalteromonas sp. SR44-5]MBB1416713.1 hypothetical protein [Pseudoalteromonas sp. SG44-1]MBB1420620.1 hypothetical protein [Pseudoalteromonas sp. SG43-7]
MKHKILAGIIITLFSTASYASIKDKKAIRAADASISAEVDKVKAACGNASLDVKVDWEDYKKMIAANKDKLAKDNYQSQWVIAHSGQRTVATLEALSAICKDDVDYKEEIAKLTKINVTAKDDFSDSASEFSLADNALTVETGHKMSRNASDFAKKIKALY